MKRPRVLLADDHVGVTEILQVMLGSEFELAGVVRDGLDLVSRVSELNPDVVVADLSMPRLDGLRAMTIVKQTVPGVKFIVMTMYQDAAIAQLVIEAGALGFVLKSYASEELIPAIHAALENNRYVSPVLANAVRSCV